MKSIVQKIVIPVSVAITLLFISIVTVVTAYTSRTIEKIYSDEMSLILDQIEGNISNFEEKLKSVESLKRESKKEKLSSLVDVAISVLEVEYDAYISGKISENTAKNNSLDIIRALSYDNNGYFWIDNTDYILQLLPPNPSLEGENRESLVDKNGTRIIKTLVDESIRNGESYLSYWFPKPGEEESSEKLGHTKLFSKWNWVVGTGFYIDEIKSEMEELWIDDITTFNNILQKNSLKEVYPIVITRGNKYISTPNNTNFLKIVETVDSVTGEDIIKMAFKIQNGVIKYNFKNSKGDIIEKRAYCRYYESLDWMLLYTVEEAYIMDNIVLQRNIIIIISIVSTIISIFILLIISGVVVKNLKTISNKVHDISVGEGDLTQEIKIKSQDETGRLSGHFNIFIKKLRALINQVKDVTTSSSQIGDVLATNAEEISATTDEISATMRSISEKTNILSNEVNKSNDFVDHIKSQIDSLKECTNKEAEYVSESSAAVEEMVATIKTISRISIEKSKSIGGLTEVVRKGESDMNLTFNIIKEIESSAGALNNTIQTVNDVSSRINLLAMNAAIEAAHAGESGKGFAVVADEVRKLAAVTGQSTVVMTETLGNIFNLIIRSVELTENTSVSINAISKEVNDVSESFTEIIHSFTEVSEGTTQITDALERLVSTSSEVSDSTENIFNNAEKIHTSLDSVTDLTKQNNNGVGEIRDGINEISKALIELSNLSTKNSDNLTSLTNIVNRFKT